MKRFSLFEILLFITIISIHLYAAFSDAFNLPNFWFTRDDAYYYFKVAQNITLGLGSSFDGINLTNGYHPLWMLVCIPIFYLARFDLILPLRVLLIVIGLLNAGTALLIHRLISGTLSRAVGILAASFWAFNLSIHAIVYEPGLETPLAAFAVVLFIWKLFQFENEWRTRPVTSRQISILAIIAVIVMFSRLDLIFLAFIGGVWIIFRGKPIRFLLPLDAVIIFASMTVSVALRTGITSYNNLYAASATEAVLLALVIKVIALYFLGAYQHPRASSVWNITRQTGLALSVSAVLIAAVYMISLQLGIGKNFPRSAFAIDWGISMFLILALRFSARFVWFGNDKLKVTTQTSTPISELQVNWKRWLADGSVYYGILGGMLGLYMLFNKIMFGTSSPVSGQIKRWWGTMDTIYDRPAYNWYTFFGLGFQEAFDAWKPASDMFLSFAKFLKPLYPGSDTTDERYYIAITIFVLLAFILIIFHKHRTLRKTAEMALIPLAAGCGIQILSYTTTAYGGAKEWYWVSQMVFITLAGSLLIDLILRPLWKIKIARITLELAAITAAIFLANGFGSYVKTTMLYNYYPKDRPYMDVVQFLQDYTAPGTVIGITGGGNVGYFIQDRTIVNMDGLINSNEYFQALKNKEAPEFLRQRGMGVIFANVQLLDLPPYYGQFQPYLENFGTYGGKRLAYLLDQPKFK
ncbi:MAG: hypothetical protein HY863_10430 [Chloroflexi bacterium]|nr:hypothetical protein [Chloroflexota bacterium]